MRKSPAVFNHVARVVHTIIFESTSNVKQDKLLMSDICEIQVQ